MNLYGAISSLRWQSTRMVVAHCNFVAELSFNRNPGANCSTTVWSISVAVLRIRSRSISRCIANSMRDQRITRFKDNGLPNAGLFLAY